MNEKSVEEQIKDKEKELYDRQQTLERYAEAFGRDRWYNRGCHDITTLNSELIELKKLYENSNDLNTKNHKVGL